MKDYVIDVLMNIGVPAGIKGFTYICDAIELFNTDPYYPDGKISALYIDIAKKYHTTPSRVERSIRHAFDIALTTDRTPRYCGHSIFESGKNAADIRQNGIISNATHKLVPHRLVSLKHRYIWKQ